MSAPVVAVSLDGKKTAIAWMDKRAGGNDPNVYWTVASGLSINGDGPANDEPRGDQNHPQVAFDKAGTAYVVWEDARGGGMQVYGTSSELKGKNVKLSSGEGTYPSIACGGGAVAVVYEAGDKVEFTLFQPER
jgi:hypothetical protein